MRMVYFSIHISSKASLRLLRLMMGLSFLIQSLDLKTQSITPIADDFKVLIKPVIPIHVYGFHLKDVQLTPGSPFHHARSKDSAFLQLLSPDRMLYRFRKHAGLPPKDSIYGGWESDGLSGHSLGHYLSAMAMMYSSTGAPSLKKKLDYTITELAIIQSVRQSGYLGAIPKEDSIFSMVRQGKIKASGFDLNGGWSPWYTVHKIMAGLCDAYYHADNKQALKIVTKMADWVHHTINHLDDSTRLEMLKCEYGGMNDVLANIYSFTRNKKYLNLSYKFFDREVMKPLSMGIDPLPGKHSNTNVPKAIGSARQFEVHGLSTDKTIATTFYNAMVDHHTYVIGGNSNYEFCGEQDRLNDRLSDNTCETCNTYNMLKLTRHLFAWSPDSKYMDYYERALYNHILASQNPDNGMMCYFVPLRMGTKKTYSDTFNTFTCCVGSGMENHSKYNEQIYNHDGSHTVFINLFIPSTVTWKANALILSQTTLFPESNEVNLYITTQPKKSTRLAFRKPFWSDTINVEINGKPVALRLGSNGYYTLNHTLMKNDRIRLQLHHKIYTESMPDNPDRIAFKYGPLVLAADLGTQRPDELQIPVLLTEDHHAYRQVTLDHINLKFHLKDIIQPSLTHFIPFYKIKDQYYSVYLDYLTQQKWEQKKDDYHSELNRIIALDKQTIDILKLGFKDEEKQHQLTHSERSYVDVALGRKGREARSGHYFQFVMKVNANVKNQLVLTYIGDDKNRTWDLLLNDSLLQTIMWPGGITGRFYDVHYDIPLQLIQGKTEVHIKIAATHNKTAGRVFTARVIVQ